MCADYMTNKGTMLDTMSLTDKIERDLLIHKNTNPSQLILTSTKWMNANCHSRLLSPNYDQNMRVKSSSLASRSVCSSSLIFFFF